MKIAMFQGLAMVSLVCLSSMWSALPVRDAQGSRLIPVPTSYCHGDPGIGQPGNGWLVEREPCEPDYVVPLPFETPLPPEQPVRGNLPAITSYVHTYRVPPPEAHKDIENAVESNLRQRFPELTREGNISVYPEGSDHYSVVVQRLGGEWISGLGAQQEADFEAHIVIQRTYKKVVVFAVCRARKTTWLGVHGDWYPCIEGELLEKGVLPRDLAKEIATSLEPSTPTPQP